MKNLKFKFLVWELAAIICVTLFAGSLSQAQTVVSRSRIGGYAEDIAYVSSGVLKDNLFMLNGYEAYTVRVTKKKEGKEALTKLCEMKFPEFDMFPNGITYVESEGLFFVNQSNQPTKLFVMDQACTLKGTRTIQYLNSTYRPAHMEGMAYIPSTSSLFPDHIIMVVWDNINGPSRLEIVRRDGVVVSEIFRSDWPEELTAGVLGDVVFVAPNRLVISTYANQIWTIDFSGNIVSGPVTAPPDLGLGEGIVQLPDSSFVATSFPQSLIFFDNNLNRAPESDRHDTIGLSLNTPRGIAWNSDTNQLLVAHDVPAVNTVPKVSAVPTSLTSATPVVNLSAFQQARALAYLPDEHLIAVLNVNPMSSRAILLFNNDGSLHSQVSLSPASLGENLGAPLVLAYLPTSNEFVVGFNGNPTSNPAAERRRLRVLSRTGTLVRTIDLTATGTGGIAAVEYFADPGGGGDRFLVFSAAGRVFVTDLNGDSRNADGFVIREFNSRVKLGLLTRNDIASITTGPLAGSFAVVDANGGELVIFRLE